jgi:hypothetical protein
MCILISGMMMMDHYCLLLFFLNKGSLKNRKPQNIYIERKKKNTKRRGGKTKPSKTKKI